MLPGANTPAGEPSPSEDDAPILGLERFAALSADIESGAARDEVAHGLSGRYAQVRVDLVSLTPVPLGVRFILVPGQAS